MEPGEQGTAKMHAMSEAKHEQRCGGKYERFEKARKPKTKAESAIPRVQTT